MGRPEARAALFGRQDLGSAASRTSSSCGLGEVGDAHLTVDLHEEEVFDERQRMKWNRQVKARAIAELSSAAGCMRFCMRVAGERSAGLGLGEHAARAPSGTLGLGS